MFTHYFSRLIMLAAGVVFLMTGCNAQNGSDDPAPVKTKEHKVSYSIGYDVGSNFTRQGIGEHVSIDQFVSGFRDGLNDTDPLLPDSTRQRILQEFQQEMMQQQQAQNQEEGAENRKEGEEFLKENLQKEDVQSTDSGLQYKVLEEGSGPSPDENDKVTVHYKGTTIDGNVFDSSHERGQPATFEVNRVIPGWTEAMQMMKEGAKWKLFIPSDLAYKERGAGPDIGPHETLIFEVELLEVEKID